MECKNKESRGHSFFFFNAFLCLSERRKRWRCLARDVSPNYFILTSMCHPSVYLWLVLFRIVHYCDEELMYHLLHGLVVHLKQNVKNKNWF